MKTSIVLTIIADDQPGIVQNVSEVLNQHGGNWSQSSMSSLAGQFAGILLASVPTENTDACIQALKGLQAGGLRVIAHVSGSEATAKSTDTYELDLVGNDRPGIVHEITTLLADYNVSVQELETTIEAASMGGGELFKATARLQVPEGADIDKIAAGLEDLANDLMVSITFN